MNLRERFQQRYLRGAVRHLNNLRIAQMARRVASLSPASTGRPVAFFKASTGIDDLSWNSGFHLLVSWALRLSGVPVAYFACDAGMSRCVLGTRRDDVRRGPPCRSCVHQSGVLYTGVPRSTRTPDSQLSTTSHWFGFERDPELEHALRPLSLAQLMSFLWPPSGESAGRIHAVSDSSPLPLGEICLPGLRWILRVHNLDDDRETRYLLREYILSAWNVARQFSQFLEITKPGVVVIFNGQFFPEAVARHVAKRRGLRVITHEVGIQPASAFLTDGEATAYPIRIPDSFELSREQDERLDAYLEQRFKGKFSMGGIQFWPTIRAIDEGFLSRLKGFRQLVVIFTNVIFDTSQPHANTIFTDMFAWLEAALQEARSHPETLFVIRAHPDETRLRKESRETVQRWLQSHGVNDNENVLFISPDEDLSSYELIQRAKFVMIYNSTIGLEASIMGRPVLCGGRARFTQYPTVFFPDTAEAHSARLREFLAAESIQIPGSFRRNARRFLYYQLFRASLPFGDFLTPSVRKTQARVRSFDPKRLLQAASIKAIMDGILEDGDFLLPEGGG